MDFSPCYRNLMESNQRQSESLKHVLHAANQHHPVVIKVRQPSLEAVDFAWHAEDFSALFHRVPSCVQRAARASCFDDDDSQRHAADDAVALRKETGDGRLIERRLETDGLLGDLGFSSLCSGGYTCASPVAETATVPAAGFQCGRGVPPRRSREPGR